MICGRSTNDHKAAPIVQHDHLPAGPPYDLPAGPSYDLPAGSPYDLSPGSS